MKRIYNSFLIAFSMYSKIPVPAVEWKKENMRYVMCFFPLVGTVLGFLYTGLFLLCRALGIGQILSAVLLTLLPVLLSGGIHMDGLMDTMDALGSYQSREKKLEILEDSHGGYFAIIVCVWYFMLAIGVWSEMPVDGLSILAYSFVISRALYGLSILAFRHAKESKCTAYIPGGALRFLEIFIMLAYVAVCGIQMIRLNMQTGAACLAGAALAFLIHLYVARKHFGGITEDSAGFFVQICEVLMPLVALIVYKQWWI